MVKRPSFQFYPGDWLEDIGLRASSLSARGLWADMLCYTHQGEPYGHLRRNDRDISTDELARMVGASPAVVARLLRELEDHNVFSRTETGTIYSRRQVRDETFRAKRAEWGKEGGSKAFENPRASRPGEPREGGKPSLRKGGIKGVTEAPLAPPPSSPSPSSTETNYPPTPPARAGGSRPAEGTPQGWGAPKPRAALEAAVSRLVERARAGGLTLTLACVRTMRREIKAGVRTEESIAEDLDAQAGAFRDADDARQEQLVAEEWIQERGGRPGAAAELSTWLAAHQQPGESRLDAGHRWREEVGVPSYVLSALLPYATSTRPSGRVHDPPEASPA